MDIEDAEVSESIASVLVDQCDSLTLHNHLAGRGDCAARIWREAVELGWLALALPENLGGLGLGARGARLLHYELGRFASPGPFIATTCALEVLTTADGEVAGDLIGRVLAGEATLAVPANAGASPTGTPMRLLGDADAVAALIPAENDSDLLLVSLEHADCSPFVTWDGTRTITEVAGLSAEPLARLPGSRMLLEQSIAIALAADSAGLARGIADRTIEYMKEREQFGKPIGSFQALKHRAANLRARSFFADNAVLHAAETCDGRQPGATIWSWLAKAEAGDVAEFVAGDCIQLFGGVGFTVEYDPHIYAKRARLNGQLLMTGAHLRNRAAAELRAANAKGLDIMELAA